MNQEMKNRLLGLNTEALVEILESVCRYAEVELHFGQDPADCINSPVFYAYEPHYGSWTVLNYDPVLDDKPKHNIDILRQERDEVIIHANNVVRESSSLITAKIPSGSCGGYWNAVDNFRRFEIKAT